MPLLPVIRDFAAEASDPRRYAALDGGWSLAVADVTGSTQLAGQGRHRDVNFVAAGVVAVLSDAVRVGQEPAACQFGGDGAIAAVPPGREFLHQAIKQLAAERAAYPEVPPHTTKRLIAAVAEGDLVVLTWHLDVPEPEDGANTYVACSFDMFRFDEDGTIVEHWDDVRKGAPH